MNLKKVILLCSLFSFASSITLKAEEDYFFQYVDEMDDIETVDAAIIIGSIVAVPILICTLHYLGFFNSQNDALDSIVNHYESHTQSLEAVINVLKYDNEVLTRQLASAISSR